MQRAGLAEGHCGTNDNVIRKRRVGDLPELSDCYAPHFS